ncbi:hypothetical protein C0J52_27056 [Blattella germanica]|nr:hypothetical protein C0J52_27056 [Blattella germanica]
MNDDFNVNLGGKQGDPLSGTLFSIVVDLIIQQLDMRGNISTKSKQCIAYADDILLTTRSKQAATELFVQLKQISLQFGLFCPEMTISLNKSNLGVTQITLSNYHILCGRVNRSSSNRSLCEHTNNLEAIRFADDTVLFSKDVSSAAHSPNSVCCKLGLR